jgi:ABC-2 type transport system ATP-binding protein
MNDEIIICRGITHRFKNEKVLDNITLTVKRGSAVGLVGKNGTGKTTFLRILGTLLEPTAGSLIIDGIDALDYVSEARLRIGWMPDHTNCFPKLSVEDSLYFVAGAHGLKGSLRRVRVEQVCDQVQLQEVWKTTTSNLSKGWNQRLGLAIMLMGEPDILILDEPAAGLDPDARIRVIALLRQLVEQGKTLIMSSHILSELAEICNRFIFLHEGKIAFDGDPETMRNEFARSSTLVLRTTSSISSIQVALREFGAVEVRQKEGGYYHITVPSLRENVIAGIATALVVNEVPIFELRPTAKSLEHSFISFVVNNNRYAEWSSQ